MNDLRRRRLSGRLREKRLELGLTQAELATVAGLHFTTVSHLESGKTDPQPRSLKRLARALGCTPPALWAKGEGEETEAAEVRFVMPTMTMRPVDVRPLDAEDVR